jgi:hypothetical protein
MLMIYAVTIVFFLGCNKENKVDPNEGELITTLKISLVEQGSTTPQVFEFRDIDGPGGQVPTKFDSIIINANKTYNATIQFLNESVTPADDITLEVNAEAADHQVYYESSTPALTVSNLNNDSNGLPLGISSTWTTVAAAKGTLRITLKHKPGAKAAGDPVSKGETDLEIGFGLRLQ